MLRQPIRLALAAALACGLANLAVDAQAQHCTHCAAGAGGQSKLFQNYYVAPGPDGGPGAQMYVSPRPTPPLVGHTYITYEPLMPHEFMTPHRRGYYRYQPGGGYTYTSVRWGHNPFNQVFGHQRQVIPNPRPKHVGRHAEKAGLDILSSPVRPRPTLYGAPEWSW